jgi:DNA invertase Pin-like site-specific DNA recombinase
MGIAVIYVRVSDSRQVDNTSLASQEEICRQWCQSRGIEVDRVFTDAGESAKTADRTEFHSFGTHISCGNKASWQAKFDFNSRFFRKASFGLPRALEHP